MPRLLYPIEPLPVIVHHPRSKTVNPSSSHRERRMTTKSGPYLPDLLGGVLHWRSIWFSARVHSCSHAVESLSTPDGDGLRPPHMLGFTARSRACFRMRFLWKKVVSIIACQTDISGHRRVRCRMHGRGKADVTHSFLILVNISQQ